MGTEALPGAVAVVDALSGISKVATPLRDAPHLDTSSASCPTPSPTLAIDNVLSSNRHKGMVATATSATARLTSPATFVQSDVRLRPQDGRIRDPVPSKLKGVDRDLSGNFSVMHMDVNSHPKSNARGAAAQRTSESTALQAKLASTPAYVSHQRRANYPKPGVPRHHITPASMPASQVQISPSPVLPAGPTSDHVPPELRSDEELVMLPLTPPEVKSEQARLLTLLRTLPPSTVVDQFCKALAFFGGVPEAPPPINGRFPESGEANGPGSLFVGWVSEIFPNLENPRKSVPRPIALPVERSITNPVAEQAPLPVKRPRGRPKGSKASKARSDKGIKKGPQSSTRKLGTASTAHVSAHQVVTLTRSADRADVASDAMHNHDGPQSTTTASQALTTSDIAEATVHAGVGSTATPLKKRGRPKGSKNRPRESLVAVLPVQTQQSIHTTVSRDQNQSSTAQQLMMSNDPDAVLHPTSTKAAIATQLDHQGVPPTERDSRIPDSDAAKQMHSVGGDEYVALPGGRSPSQSTSFDATTERASHSVADRSISYGTDVIMPSSGKRKRHAELHAALNTIDAPMSHVHPNRDQGPLPIATSPLSQDNGKHHVATSANTASSVPKAKRARRTKVNPWMRDLVGERPIIGEPAGPSVDRPGATSTVVSTGDSQKANAMMGGSHRVKQDRQYRSRDPKSPHNVAGGLNAGLNHIEMELASTGHGERPMLPTTIADQQRKPFSQQNSAASQMADEISPQQERQQSSRQQRQHLAWTHNDDQAPGTLTDSHPAHHRSTGQQPPPPPYGQRQRGDDDHSPVDTAQKAPTNQPHGFGASVQGNHQRSQSHALKYGSHESLSNSSPSHPHHNTQLASPMEQSLYRSNLAGGSSTRNHQTLQSLQPSFGEYQGSHLFGMQNLEHNDDHNDIGLDGGPYSMQLSSGANLRRTERNSGTPGYSTTSGIDTFIAQTGLAPNNHQNRWHG